MKQLDWIKLDECHLNEYDMNYIEKMRYKYLELLWDKLNKQHFQYFEIKKVKINRSYPKIYHELNWEKKTINEICDIYNINYHTLYGRINRWHTIEQALVFSKCLV